MGYDRNDCWMTCGERDDKCAAMGLMDGPITKDPFAEIERLRSWMYEALNSLGDPQDAGDHDDSEEKALLATIDEAIGKLRTGLGR